MPKSAADKAQETREMHNRLHQVEQPLRQRIRELEAKVSDLEKQRNLSLAEETRAEQQRDHAVKALDALIVYLATVKSA